ncbi:polysaccharide biosynthesis protein [Pontimicrobium sp. IMCC45349]|uniref:polysaccharide biosynthesis protein n=1 Tax=Pontimicrobium sp. IMCC45349 TaxID=3391574 RepID=UPI0039A05D27
MLENYLNKITQKYASKWLVLAIDVIIVLCTLFLANFIRYNFRFDFDMELLLRQAPFVAIIATISFLLVGSHKGVVRYTGYRDVINIIIGTNILATILIIFTYLGRKFGFDKAFEISGSIVYIHLLLNILLLTSFKFVIKALYREIVSEHFEESGNILIYGAGDSGLITYDAVTTDAKSNLEVIGFIDDNPKKVGKKINLVNVFSFDQINDDFIKKNKIDQVIISIQNIEPLHLLNISSKLFAQKLKVKIVPPVHNWIDGDLSVGQIKDVKIEDLLGRDPIDIDNPVLDDEYENQIILITGAAGSIGSEICRKLTNYNCKKLIFVDIAESALYDLQQEFKQQKITNFEAIVADVRDKDRMNYIFNKHKPKIVFHAAAYKHVPLMENNPYEAVRVNICGTKIIADLSVKHSIKKFVLISTDKAVNPTNVMGATKRIAELYVSCLKGKGQTKFITTRFGNVLGSNGSVIPLFKKQIESGGPLTVTHRDITRYFMTIPEACQLVLEAATMGNGGEIFVFDMGESVKIFDLAKNMITLSGLKYPEDIDIKITGLRPGEKIYEELLADGENTKKTYHEKIMIAKTRALDIKQIESKITNLCCINSKTQSLEIVSNIKDIIPEYVSNNSKFEVLDSTKK